MRTPITFAKTWNRIQQNRWAHVLKFVILVSAVVWLTFRGSQSIGYNWQWYQIPKYLFTVENGRYMAGPLLKGLLVTMHITGVSLLVSLFFGLLAAIMRLSNSFFARLLARGYVELIRNTPLLIQIFFIYFVIAPPLDMGRVTSAILALSLFEGAYASEIFRSGIVSINKGQWEAAYSLGLSTFSTYWHVILPQAIQRILPPLTSQAISLVKDSALVSTIAIYDLTMQGQAIVAKTFLTFEVWFTVAAIYLIVNLALSFAVSLMENRLRLSH